MVIELSGSVSGVQITSLQGPRSPLRPCALRLQDSLDFAMDHVNKHDSMLGKQLFNISLYIMNQMQFYTMGYYMFDLLLFYLESLEVDNPNFEFCDYFGKNIKLNSCRKIARRVKSYNNGIVFTNKPLVRGQQIMVSLQNTMILP